MQPLRFASESTMDRVCKVLAQRFRSAIRIAHQKCIDDILMLFQLEMDTRNNLRSEVYTVFRGTFDSGVFTVRF